MTSPKDTSPPGTTGSGDRRAVPLLAGVALISLLTCAAGVALVRLLPASVGDLYQTDIFFHQFMLHEGPGALLTAAVLLAALLATRLSGGWVERVVGYFATRTLFVATVSFFVLAAAAILVYQNHPLAMDEYMAYFQAQIFAEGEIYGSFPPELLDRLVPHFFLNKTFIAASLTSGKVISTYLPGFALLLTPFMKLGVPWALNPLLSAITLLLIAHLARKLSDDPLAPGWAVLFTLASPIFAVNAISYYSSPAHLAANLLFMTLLLPVGPEGNRRTWRLVAAGAVGSLALTLHHPVAHALFAVPWLIWLLWRRELKNLAILLAAYLPLALVLGVGWIKVRSIVGDENAVLTAANATAPAATSIFMELRAFLGVLQIPDAELLTVRLLGFLKLFFWAVPGLPLLAILGWPKLRQRSTARLLAWSTIATLGFYFLVTFSQGHGWGYRYFHPVWAVLPLFAAAAMASNAERPPGWRRFAGALAVLSLIAGTWLRFGQVHDFIAEHRAQMAMAESVPQVRFVDIRTGYYIQDLIHNDPFLRGPEWTFISFGREADADLVRNRFPGAELAVDLGHSTAWTVE